MTEARPLLIFDSGVGGLSVLQPIRALLPKAPIVYAADSAGFPYGTKSEREIAARVPALLGRLAEQQLCYLLVTISAQDGGANRPVNWALVADASRLVML